MKLQPEPLPRERYNWVRLVLPPLVLVILGVIFFLGLDFTGKSSFCESCHAMSAYVKSWRKGSHKDAQCVDCHADPGVVGALIQRSEIVKHYGLTSLYFQRQRPTLAAGAVSAGCLKCHQSIERRTIRSAAGIRVSHQEILAAGLNCGRCHADVAHFSKAAKAQRPAHDYCFACHQKFEAGGRCSFCHTRDIGDKGQKQIDNYRKVELDLNQCDGCHSTNTCAGCHPSGRRLETY